jgi:hypothetical protein
VFCRCRDKASSGVYHTEFTSPMPPRNAVPVISEAMGLVEASPASSEPYVGLWIYH